MVFGSDDFAVFLPRLALLLPILLAAVKFQASPVARVTRLLELLKDFSGSRNQEKGQADAGRLRGKIAPSNHMIQ